VVTSCSPLLLLAIDATSNARKT